MNTRTPLIASALLAASLISGAAHATLEGRDLNGSMDSFEAYYDTDLNVTWLADADNTAMQWVAANTWATDLYIVDAVNNITYDNWRLPTTLQLDASCSSQSGFTSSGWNCSGSEMGHLFYSEFGGTAMQPYWNSTDPDLAKFTSLQAGAYWSGTRHAYDIMGRYWFFEMVSGYQYIQGRGDAYNVLVVSDGDIGIAAIPEAETYAMMLAGLGLVGAMARRRKLAKV